MCEIDGDIHREVLGGKEYRKRRVLPIGKGEWNRFVISWGTRLWMSRSWEKDHAKAVKGILNKKILLGIMRWLQVVMIVSGGDCCSSEQHR